MFDPLMDVILKLASDLFSFLVGLLIIVIILGIIYNALKASAFSILGGSQTTAVAVLSTIGLILMALFTFLVIPQVHTLLEQWRPVAPFAPQNAPHTAPQTFLPPSVLLFLTQWMG